MKMMDKKTGKKLNNPNLKPIGFHAQ